MMELSVEVTTAPVGDDGWTCLREVLEAVPGSLLIEDAKAPVVILPVTAPDATSASSFVQGLFSLKGLKIVQGKIGPAPDDDFEFMYDDNPVAVSLDDQIVTTHVQWESGRESVDV